MKKAAVFTAACLLFSLLLISGAFTEKNRQEEYTCGDYTYTLREDGTAEICKYTGTESDVVIPASLDGKAVTFLGSFAFNRCDDLVSVTIPEGVTALGEKAFSDCHKLETVVIPDSVAAVAPDPFDCCESLKNIILSPGHPYLETADGMLYSKPDRRLICSMRIPDGSTCRVREGTRIIGRCAFSCQMGLEHILLPDSLEFIDTGAFYACQNLVSVRIPDSVTAIGREAFSRCLSLKYAVIPDSVTEFDVSESNYGEEYSLFYNCNIGLTITVGQGSCAEQYLEKEGRPYIYRTENSGTGEDGMPTARFLFRDRIRWNMSVREVTGLEGESCTKTETEDVTAILYENVPVNRYAGRLGYVFREDRLIACVYGIPDPDDEMVRFVRKELTEAYGREFAEHSEEICDEPITAVTGISLHEDVWGEPSCSKWIWQDGTRIYLCREEGLLVLMYTSPEFIDLLMGPYWGTL